MKLDQYILFRLNLFNNKYIVIVYLDSTDYLNKKIHRYSVKFNDILPYQETKSIIVLLKIYYYELNYLYKNIIYYQ